jgi:hypothetical protein
MDLSKLKFDREKASSVIGIAAAACLVYSTLSLVLKKKEHKGLKEIPVPSSCYPYVGKYKYIPFFYLW